MMTRDPSDQCYPEGAGVRLVRALVLIGAALLAGLACDRLREQPVFFSRDTLPEFTITEPR